MTPSHEAKAASARLSPEAMIARIKGALSVWIRVIEVETGERSAALSFTHPVHGATVMVVADGVEDDDASVGVFVILGDYDGLRGDDDAIFRLFSLNATLMSCAVGLLRLNEDEIATALCRRLPAAEVEATEVRELIDAMIWEYAHTAGFVAADGGVTGVEADA
jgi:hypothetical protein